jgi:hypothetical protein
VADPPAQSRGHGRSPQPIESVQVDVTESEQIARTVTMTRTSRGQSGSQAAPIRQLRPATRSDRRRDRVQPRLHLGPAAPDQPATNRTRQMLSRLGSMKPQQAHRLSPRHVLVRHVDFNPRSAVDPGYIACDLTLAACSGGPLDRRVASGWAVRLPIGRPGERPQGFGDLVGEPTAHRSCGNPRRTR